jgi:hypothetical protein
MPDDDPVSRNSPNTKKDAIVPIVVVPGVMGTRLDFPKDGVAWDPDKPILEMWRNWYKKTAEEKAAILDSQNPATIIEEDVGQGWGTVAKDFYRAFLEYLQGLKFRKAVCKVYATGYDWRLSCMDSGRYVAAKIDRAMELERAKRAIVITHSMGGLVTRAALEQVARLKDKLLGVIHVVQPVSGSPVLYRRFFTGLIEGWDGDKYITDILGNTPYSFVLVLSGIPGAFELLPTQQYRYIPAEFNENDPDLKTLHGPWESPAHGVRDSGGRMVYPAGVNVERYLSADSPPGLFNEKLHSKKKKDGEKTRKKVEAQVRGADAFHRRLGLNMHWETRAIYSTGLETDVAVRYPMKKELQMAYRKLEGDGTVPETSGGGLYAESYPATAKNAESNNNRQFFVNGAEHGGIFANAAVRETIEELVKQWVKNA